MQVFPDGTSIPEAHSLCPTHKLLASEIMQGPVVEVNVSSKSNTPETRSRHLALAERFSRQQAGARHIRNGSINPTATWMLKGAEKYES